MRGTRLFGANTDPAGIRRAWEIAALPEDGPVTVLGSGGAAAAALVAIAGREIQMMARRSDAAQKTADRVGVTVEVVPWGADVKPGVLVNATPIGMKGERLPDNLTDTATGLFDMAYGDAATPAVVESGARGLPVAAGLDMLVGQAVESFRIWFGVSADPEVMRQAADDELARRRGVS